MKNILKQLCLIDGVSGRENLVRETIISLLPSDCEYTIDALGNLIVTKTGKKSSKNRIMLSAHMDEVGMIVTFIEQDGSLRFSTVGGIDPDVIVGSCVRVNNISGVIGSKPIHLKSAQDRSKSVSIYELFIDIGASCKEQAEEHVNLGDVVTFDSEFLQFGEGKVKSKAIDDRFGCAVLLKLLREDIEYDFTCAFLVQEEVGLRGARPATYAVNPDIAVVFETTTAADTPLSAGKDKVCVLGSGAVVSFMDNATIYDSELYKLAFLTAKENNVLCQTKTAIAGGNDAGAISQSRNGVKTISISLPCRYLHSACCVADEQDMDAILNLATKILPKLFEL